ncbi:MAG: RNA polymerase sigma-70 factor [Dysgonomonas sp.]|jgi:RNA polymerase sigma-70 factor (ECF subfamily)|nr:RNA polymerase sigma-70 factor [Prevotella sp.]
MEKHWLRAIACGDQKAFDELFIEYFPKIKKFLFGFLESDAEAEDLAQDVFVKLWQNRSFLENVDNLNAYLYRMSKNMLFNYLKHPQIKELTSISNFLEIPTMEKLEEIIFAKELEVLIDTTIDRMPTQRKTIFNLSRKEKLTNTEIATRLKISKRTVEAHISAALSDLRKVLYIFFIFF